jgi:hypothetical protein
MASDSIPLSTLTEYLLDTHNSSIRDVLRADDEELEGGGIDFDPPYQRASVWTMKQRVNLIKSCLQGLPLGAVFINDRGDYVKRIVDGKQRLETFRRWFDGTLRVPREWFTPELVETAPANAEDVSYQELSLRGQRFFVNHATIATYWTRLKTVAEEEDLYLRINYGGTPHEAH